MILRPEHSDAGFGEPSTFGGVIPTPALGRIAADGLRYTNFHSTALCSPARAALTTGRNHHSAGFGCYNWGSPLPARKRHIGPDTGTPVDGRDYQVPFNFTGKIAKLAIKVEPPVLTEEDKHWRKRSARLRTESRIWPLWNCNDCDGEHGRSGG
jgi:hypothetical protein